MSFQKIFHKDYILKCASHGRVNLIGEHTDYNHGFVLPATIPESTQIYLAPRSDKMVYAVSVNRQQEYPPYSLEQEKLQGNWTDYIQGVTFILRKEKKLIYGFDAFISSTVPIGQGLSSSAALQVGLIKGLNLLFQLNLSDLEVALLAQKAESQFVGAKVGVMDQMSTSIGKLGEALFIDTKDLSYERISLPLDEIEFLIVHSGISHSNVSGQYNHRREECLKSAEILGIESLRDLSKNYEEQILKLPETLRKRVRHVVTENARVVKAVRALKDRDFVTLGQLFYSSHKSMTEDYQVSLPEIDFLVDLAKRQPKVLGARLTGGGFGGCIVCLVERGAAKEIGPDLQDLYRRQTGFEAPFYFLREEAIRQQPDVMESLL